MSWLTSKVRLLRRWSKSGSGTMSVGVGKGLRFDPATSNSAYASGANELEVQQMLAKHLFPGAVFYDVGANVGFLSIIAAHLVGPTGTVYAFEPVPENAAAIRHNSSANGFQNIQVIEVAVTHHSGTGELALAAYSGGAVLAEVAKPPDWSGMLQVRLGSIDDLVELEGLKAPSFVKIDVEGAELGVLEGMRRTCARYRPIILYEVDDAELGPLQRKQTLCEQWLDSHGYCVSEIPDSYAGIQWFVKHYVAVPTSEQ